MRYLIIILCIILCTSTAFADDYITKNKDNEYVIYYNKLKRDNYDSRGVCIFNIFYLVTVGMTVDSRMTVLYNSNGTIMKCSDVDFYMKK